MHSTNEKPNILWISLEDTSPRMGCYGDNVARTPNIDRLAQEGTMYENAFCTAGVCAPSRSSIITGMYANSIGTHHMRTEHDNKQTPELPTPYYAVPPAHVKLIPEILRANGYYTTNNAKTDYQFLPPVTAWDENGTKAHWRNRNSGQPFFSVFNYDATHESAMFADNPMAQLLPLLERGQPLPEQVKNLFKGRSIEEIKKSITQERPVVTDPDKVEVPPYLPDTPKTRLSIAKLYDRIADADQFVGKLLEQLEEDGLRDNTIVILWSDHGEGLPRAKRWPYDAGIRIPLIVRWPGKISEGHTTAQLVSLIDLGPTMLSLADIPVPQHIQGKTFIGNDDEERQYVFATRDRYDEAYDKVRAIRDDRFKYIRNYYPENPYMQWVAFSHDHPAFQELWRLQLAGEAKGDLQAFLQNKRPPEELYDCVNDPDELNNLASDPQYKEQLGILRAELDKWCEKYDVWGDIPEDQMVKTMWPEGIQPQTAKPLFIPINGQVRGKVAASEGVYHEPTAIMLHSATQGASITYTFEEGDNANWKLYTGPIILNEGSKQIRAKSVRIGYKDSEEAVGLFEVAKKSDK
ncbi:sulfatase-like hydrolase/transferase [Litchfieldia alkalitelluris]|uniref:sulfatase-like hydrolase/transferase n=1 Tax=Litchfieldia alkalitelluris TaxID=304268 RepID=UPI0009975F35|nr:sulfatase-like hydrolase/transferase [Litchfieldia alkalitelluris]